jgi:hypothetical protein
MSAEEQSRELMTEERHNQQNRQESMETRAKSEHHDRHDQAREILTEDRQKEHNR